MALQGKTRPLVINRQSGLTINGLIEPMRAQYPDQAQAFTSIQDRVNDIYQVLRGNGAIEELTVVDTSGQLIGWIGSRAVGNASFFGGWFKQLYVGGKDPTQAPLHADVNGNLILGGNNLGTPYVSVRDNSNVEIGRIGANIDTGFSGAWFKQIRIGGPDLQHPQIFTDSSGNVTITAGLTANAVHVVSGAVSIDIDAADLIKITDSAIHNVVQMTNQNFTLTRPSVDVAEAVMSLQSFFIQDSTGSNSILLGPSSATISGPTLTIDLDTSNCLKFTTGTNSSQLTNQQLALTRASDSAEAILGLQTLFLQNGAGTVNTTVNPGAVFINNQQVLNTRVVATPVVLADVIAVLQHHGLSN